MNTRFSMSRPMRRKNTFGASGGNTQTPPIWEDRKPKTGIMGAFPNNDTYGQGGGGALPPRPNFGTFGQSGNGSVSGPVSGMPTATPPSGPPKELNPRRPGGRLPPQGDAPTQTPPTWIPPTTSPAPGGGPKNNWSNRVNFNPGHYSSWRPEGWDTMNEQDRLAWSNSIRDMNDPNFDQSWGELGDYFSGTMLSMLDPRNAQRVARNLDANRAGEQNFGVGVDDFWLNPAMGGYDDADRAYLSADRATTARSFWDTALQDLMGSAGGMPQGDINQSPLGALQDVGNQVFDLMAQYGLQGNQSQRNRFSEQRFQEDLGGILGSMENSPLEQFAGVFEALANPQRFRQQASPTRFGMIQPPRR